MNKQKKNSIKNSINLIIKLINEKKIDDAEKIILELKQSNPVDSALYFNHGIIFLNRNKIKEASNEFKKSIENSNSEKSINAYIETLLLLKDYEKALKEIDRLFSKTNKSFFNFQRKKIIDKKAINDYQRFFPRIDSKKNDYIEFYKVFMKDKKIIKNNSKLCGIFGSWIFEGTQKKFLGFDLIKISIDLLKKAIFENPDNKSYLKNISLALRRLGKPKESIKFLEKLLALEENLDNFILIGNCYSDLKDYNLAITYYRNALIYERNDETAIMNIAICYKASNKVEEALKYYQKVIELKGNFTSRALNGIAVINEEKNNFEKSEQYFLQSLKLEPSNRLFKRGLARLYNKMGRKLEALKIKAAGEGIVVFDEIDNNKKELNIINK